MFCEGFIENDSHSSAIPKNKSYLTYGLGALTHFATFKQIMYLKSGGINPSMKRAVDQDLYYRMEEQGGHLFLENLSTQFIEKVENRLMELIKSFGVKGLFKT